MAEPIIKWVGGKRQLISELKSRFPVSYNDYHEPFVGGGGVFFDIEPESGSINDLNERLITLYRAMRDHPEEVIEQNREHEYEEDYYYDAREEFNSLFELEDCSEEDEIRAASLFICLNRSCFNGLYRENNSGEFNVPFGRYTDPDLVRARQIRQGSKALYNISIYNEDFKYIRSVAESGDLVYFDPPYEPVSTTADFTEYQADGFSKEDQQRLRDVAAELDEAGIHVVISNSPPVSGLYTDLKSFEVDTVDARRSINSDPDNRDAVAEVIITNIDQSDRRQPSLGSFL